MASIGSLTADLKLESAAFIRDLAKAQAATARSTAAMSKSMAQMQSGFARAAGSVKALAAGFISFAAVRRVASFTKSALESASAIKEQAEALGLGVEKFQAYQIAAEQSGGSAEGVTKQIGFFVRAVGQAQQGIGGFAKALMESNPHLLAQLQGTSDVSEAFDIMLEAIRKAPNDFERNRLAALAFGKDAKTAIALATNSSKEMRQALIDSGAVIKSDVAAKVDDLMDKLSMLGRGFTAGFSNKLIETLAGSIGKLNDDQLTQMVALGERVGTVLGKALDSVVKAFEFAHHHADELKGVIGTLVAIRLEFWALSSAGAMVALARSMEEASLAALELKGSVLALSRLVPIIAILASFGEKADELVEASEKVKKANEALAANGGNAAEALKTLAHETEHAGAAAEKSGSLWEQFVGKINSLFGASEAATEANKRNAEAVANVSTQLDTATQRIFGYNEALSKIPATITTQVQLLMSGPIAAEELTEGKASIGQLFGIPHVEEFAFAAEGVNKVKKAADEAAPSIDKVKAGLAAAGEAAAGMGAMHEMTALQLQNAWFDVAGSIAGSLGALFNDNKAFAIAQTVINTAQAIMNAMANAPWPLSIAAAAAAALAGAAQIAQITRTRPGSGSSVKKPSASSGSGARASGGGGRGEEAVAGRESSLAITLVGQGFTQDQIRNLLADIQTELDNGSTLRVTQR